VVLIVLDGGKGRRGNVVNRADSYGPQAHRNRSSGNLTGHFAAKDGGNVENETDARDANPYAPNFQATPGTRWLFCVVVSQ